MKSVSFLAVAVALTVTKSVASPAAPVSQTRVERDGKFLNLPFLPFVSIRIQPSSCTAKSDNSSGICTSTGDCSRRGGRKDGSCGIGFGVCCVYEMRCGGTVTQNNTLLLNNDYPETSTGIDNCQYTIEKVSDDVCQVRLDFDTLRLQGPDNTSQCSEDTFTFLGTTGANPTVICGDNTGQHMYVDVAGGTGSARVNIATTSDSFPRTWRIRVTQITCSSPERAPPNCLQYYADYSGTINSFNYQDSAGVQQLSGQRYTACVKAREGFCGIKYAAQSFSLSGNASDPAPSSGDADCQSDFVLIPEVDKAGSVTVPDRYCGSDFVELTTYSTPFEVRVVTDQSETATDVDNKGFSLRYTQIPC